MNGFTTAWFPKPATQYHLEQFRVSRIRTKVNKVYLCPGKTPKWQQASTWFAGFPENRAQLTIYPHETIQILSEAADFH
jgi:hypothetical protein